MIETLEDRRLYSATVARVGTTLVIAGTSGSDGIVVQQMEAIKSDGSVGNETIVSVFDLDHPTADGSPNQTYDFTADQQINTVVAALGDGNDIYDGTTCFCSQVVDGGKGDDVIVTGDNDDIIVGGDGDDTLFGQGGNDIIFGNKGDDTISGGDGVNHVFGGAGNNTILD